MSTPKPNISPLFAWIALVLVNQKISPFKEEPLKISDLREYYTADRMPFELFAQVVELPPHELEDIGGTTNARYINGCTAYETFLNHFYWRGMSFTILESKLPLIATELAEKGFKIDITDLHEFFGSILKKCVEAFVKKSLE